MNKTTELPEGLDDAALDEAAGGFKVEIEGVTQGSFEAVTLERGLVDKSAEKMRPGDRSN